MNTIHDVAKLAGVSTGTVSNVINNSKKVSPETAKRVKEAISELNYIPNIIAKSLKTNSSRVIGILAEDVGGFFSGHIIDGICSYCESHDYSVHLCNLLVHQKVKTDVTYHYREMEESEAFKLSLKNNLNTLLTARVCGLIYIGTHPRDVSNILPALSIPVVYAYAYTKDDDYCINYDDFQGAKLAVDYLIQNGHKRIALLSGAVDSVPAHRRMMGYQTSLMEHGLAFDPALIRTGNWQFKDGYRHCLSLLQSASPPTALFAMSDMMAIGAIRAITETGLRIPDDISVHGFDDLELTALLTPALTTVHLPLTDIGIQSAAVMDSLLCGDTPSLQNLLLPCSHMARNTVAPPLTAMP